MKKKIFAFTLTVLLCASAVFGWYTLNTSDTVKDAVTGIAGNAVTLQNYINGTTAPTLLTPTIASFVNANHTHASAAQGGTLTNGAIASPVLSGTASGTITVPASTFTQPSWTTISSFSLSHVTLRTVKYMKDSQGFVHFKGATQSGTSNGTVTTLPSGYCPDQAMYFWAGVNNVGDAVEIYITAAAPTCNVVTYLGTTTAVMFDHIVSYQGT